MSPIVDNVAVTPGTGLVVAAHDVGGVLYQRVQPVTGSTDVSAASGLPVAGSYVELTGNSTATGAISLTSSAGGTAASFDVRGYSYAQLHLTGGSASNVYTIQYSNDNATWVTAFCAPTTGSFGTVSLTNTQGPIVSAITGRYFRVNCAAYTSGTTVATVELTAGTAPTLGAGGTPVALTASTVSGNADALAQTSTVAAAQMGYVGASTYDRVRVPNTVKTAVTQATGNTALWTPTTGKKFRVMRVMVQVTADAATAGGADITIDLKDGATTSTNLTFSVYVPAVAATTFSPGFQIGWLDLGNGVLSAAANNVLNVNASAALTSGWCRVIVAGTEE